jgi:hypothetical protein
MNGIEKIAGRPVSSPESSAPQRRLVSDKEQNAFAEQAQGQSAGSAEDCALATDKPELASLLAEASRSLRSSLGMQMRQTADRMLKENIEE